jgi:hypothetical protein
VATIAASHSSGRGAAKAPISTHPAFPAIVALWFAALLGLGSLVLPVELIERLVSASGVASVIPAAAPPLGFTAHVSIALTGAIAGALLGLTLARKVARAHSREPQGRSFALGDSAPPRPISARDELGEEDPDASFAGQLPAQKRRSLAMSEDSGRSAFLQMVPLPGQEGGVGDDFSMPAVVEGVDAFAREPLDLTDFAGADAEDGEAASADETKAFDSAEADCELADPLPFAAPSLRRTAPIESDAHEIGEEEDTGEPDEQSAEEEPAMHLSVIESGDEPAAVDYDRPLEDLGLVQLAARLGASIQKRRERLAAPQPAWPVSALPPVAGGEEFEVAEADDAARAIADFFCPATDEQPVAEGALSDEALVPTAPAVPASLRALSIDNEDDLEDEALAASFSLPLGRTITTVEPVDATEEADDEYGSLLGMKNPFARPQEFVRIEEPEDTDQLVEPAVTFPPARAATPPDVWSGPAEAPARPFDPPTNLADSAIRTTASAARRDPADAERSLRDALATLQRMSGAA